MDVNLHIVNTQLQTPAWDVQLRLTARGITLGRHPSSDVHLDDPERVISGQHARLEARNGGLWITDISRNGTYLNNANDPLPPQQPVAISAGDRLVIGSFNITITVNGQQLSSAVEVADSPQDAAGLLNTQPTPDILDLLNPSIGGQTAADFIPPAARSGASATATEPFNSTLDGFAPAAPAREMRPPPTPVEHVCYRPAAMPDDYDLLNDAWRNAAPPAKSPDTIATASTSSPPSAVNAELSAFFAGLGIEPPATAPQAEVLFRQAGELLRVFATGLSMTLMARAQFKNELRLGVTTIRAAENNPFKFSVDSDSLLKQLLLQSNPGFLPAVIAAQAGFDDIQAHEMAMTAGLQAALRALFARFDPTELERQLSNSGVNPVLPMARRARCWELFAETYEQMAAEASEDFMQLFDTSFARAYQEQIRRLTEMHRNSRKS